MFLSKNSASTFKKQIRTRPLEDNHGLALRLSCHPVSLMHINAIWQKKKKVTCPPALHLRFLLEYHEGNSSFTLLKNLLKLNLWFKRYRQLSEAKNNKIVTELNYIIDCISKLILPTNEPCCLMAFCMIREDTLVSQKPLQCNQSLTSVSKTSEQKTVTNLLFCPWQATSK